MRTKHHDLIICMRVHKWYGLILDTYDSVKCNTDSNTTLVICAVDNNEKLANRLRKKGIPTYCSTKRWGWGAGLYSLLIESISWAEERFNFSHFLSIDYDTYFIRPKVDEVLLSAINSPLIGLIGDYNGHNLHWIKVWEREQIQFQKVFGKVPQIYVPGEGVSGSCMLLTRSAINNMKNKGMFAAPYSKAKKYTQIADDHLLPIFIRQCGLEIVDCHGIIYCKWNLDKHPFKLPTETYVFHPTKIRSGPSVMRVEVEVRNHFRKLRNRLPIPGKGTSF